MLLTGRTSWYIRPGKYPLLEAAYVPIKTHQRGADIHFRRADISIDNFNICRTCSETSIAINSLFVPQPRSMIIIDIADCKKYFAGLIVFITVPSKLHENNLDPQNISDH